MKKLDSLVIVALALLFAVFSLTAQENSQKKETAKSTATAYKGYLVDKMCGTGFTKSGDVEKATAKAKKHTKDCALEDHCAASGYGLIMEGKFLKFDAKGDTLAFHYLNKTKRASNLVVEVKGKMDGDNIMVASLKDGKQ